MSRRYAPRFFADGLHLAPNAAAPVAFAAEELRRYLHRLTGQMPTIVPDLATHTNALVLGGDAGHPVSAPNAAQQTAGTYALVPKDTQVALWGASPRALLAAAYALLEQLGCRWSLHGPDEEVVPALAGPVEVHAVTYVPRFRVRGYCSDIMTWHYTQPEQLRAHLGEDRPFIDWMGKRGATTFFFIRHPFDSQLHIPELTHDYAQRGIDVECGGHVIPLLLPREEFDAHPDCFPQRPSGERTPYGNLCTSNPEALAMVRRHAVAALRESPEMAGLHVWGADLLDGGWCHCPACRGLSVADQNLRTCNAVADALSEAALARPVYYLAYHDTLEPDLTVPPHDGVVAEFAPRERCYAHAINDPACPTNPRYRRALERHVELFSGRVRLFEYYGDAILFFGCAVPLSAVIAADLAYYQGLGITEILMLQFGRFSHWAYPLNFETFAAGTHLGAAIDPGDIRSAYCARFGVHATAAGAAFGELEDTMRQVVTYGDIRRPPRKAAAAASLATRLEHVLPRLGTLAASLHTSPDPRLRAQAALVRYTHSVLVGVHHELQTQAPATDTFDAALRILDAVDRSDKGSWGAVDAAVVHGFFSMGGA